MDDVTSQGGEAATAEALVQAVLQQALGELGGQSASLGSREAPPTGKECGDVQGQVRVDEFPPQDGVPADANFHSNPAFEDSVMGGEPGQQVREFSEPPQLIEEAAAGAGHQPLEHRDEEGTKLQQYSGADAMEIAGQLTTANDDCFKPEVVNQGEALIGPTVGLMSQPGVQPDSVTVELSVGPDETVAVNLAPAEEQVANAAIELNVGLGEIVALNVALTAEQHVISEPVTQQEQGNPPAQNMGQGFRAAMPGYDAVDSLQQPLLNWGPAAGSGRATRAPEKQPPELLAAGKQTSSVRRAGNGQLAASTGGRLPLTKEGTGSSIEGKHRPGPKPLVRPKPGNLRQSPPTLGAASAQQGQGQMQPRLSGSQPPAVLPAGWVETTDAESESESQGGSYAGYGVSDFTGLQWGPRHEASPTTGGDETIMRGGSLGRPMMSSGDGLNNGLASPRQHKMQVAASISWPQEGQAYSVLQRKRSLSKGALERGQPGYAEVEPDAMFQDPPSPKSLGPHGESPLYEEVASVEATPPRKPASKPSVSEILAKAGVKLKPKQEQGGPRTAPPRQQQAMSQDMLPEPAGFPDQLMDPRAALSWSSGYVPGVVDAQQSYAPMPRQLGPYTAMAGSPGAGHQAPQWVSQDHRFPQGFPGQAPQQQHWQQGGEGYSIAASWPPYEGARLPALSPDPTYQAGGGRAAGGLGPMAWNPAGHFYPGHYAAAYGTMPDGSSPMATGAASPPWYGLPVETGGSYGNTLPPLPGSATAAAAWMAGQAQFAGQPAFWPAPMHAPMYNPRQQNPPQQQPGPQPYKAQGKSRSTVLRQHGVFIARPSKVFHGLQARSKHQPPKYQDDGRPEFSLK